MRTISTSLSLSEESCLSMRPAVLVRGPTAEPPCMALDFWDWAFAFGIWWPRLQGLPASMRVPGLAARPPIICYCSLAVVKTCSHPSKGLAFATSFGVCLEVLGWQLIISGFGPHKQPYNLPGSLVPSHHFLPGLEYMVHGRHPSFGGPGFALVTECH